MQFDLKLEAAGLYSFSAEIICQHKKLQQRVVLFDKNLALSGDCLAFDSLSHLTSVSPRCKCFAVLVKFR